MGEGGLWHGLRHSTSHMPSQSPDFHRESIDQFRSRLCTSPNQMRDLIIGTLRNRGAVELDAEEAAEQVIAECLLEGGESLLARFHGRCAMDAWLLRVAINRVTSIQRRKGMRRRWMAEHEAVAVEECRIDAALRETVRRALRTAIAGLPHQWRVMLWLRHGFGVSQERLGKSWRYSSSKVSRILSEARSAVKRETVAALAREEPGLVLGWEEICAACSDDELLTQ